MQGELRNNHPEIFMDLDAPDELKDAFYRNRLEPEFLYKHKEYLASLAFQYISYLKLYSYKEIHYNHQPLHLLPEHLLLLFH